LIFLRPKIKKKITYGPDFDYGAVDEELDCHPLPMSHEEFEEKKLKFLASLKLNMHEINELQSRTVEQSNCEEWKKERSKRLTASNFGKICKLRKTTSREKSVISIIYQSDFFHGTSATRYILTLFFFKCR